VVESCPFPWIRDQTYTYLQAGDSTAKFQNGTHESRKQSDSTQSDWWQPSKAVNAPQPNHILRITANPDWQALHESRRTFPVFAGKLYFQHNAVTDIGLS
jgi:hypothetical protein